MRPLCLYFFLILFSEGYCKKFNRCSLVNKLVELGVENDKLAIWVCIAFHESGFNTKQITVKEDRSKAFGIFQVKNTYWCDLGSGGCNVPCHSLVDCQIADDLACARHIHHETEIRSFSGGDGFVAWESYRNHCDQGRAEAFLLGCNM